MVAKTHALAAADRARQLMNAEKDPKKKEEFRKQMEKWQEEARRAK